MSNNHGDLAIVTSGVKVLGEQLHITKDAALVREIAPVRNHFVKPHGGFWTSSYIDGKSEWVDAHQDMFADSRGCAYTLNWFLLTVDPAARILVVDSMADLKWLLRKYPFALIPGAELYPNFEAISQDYDAMNLTSEGQWATRLTIPTLYGWDSESTVWFRWRFTVVRQIAAPPRPAEDEAPMQSRVDQKEEDEGSTGLSGSGGNE